MIFRRLINLPKAIRATVIWNRSLDNARNKDYNGALRNLVLLGESVGGTIREWTVPYYVNILASNIYCKVGDFKSAVEAAQMAIRQVREESTLSDDEKRYCIYYCNTSLDYALYNLHDAVFCDAIRTSEDDINDYASIVLSAVRRELRQDFPITDPRT